MFLDAEGRTLLEHGGPRTVKGFEGSLAEAQEFLTLVKQAEAGDASIAAEVLIRQIRLEWFGFDEAKQKVEALEKVSAKQRKELEQLLVGAEVKSVLASAGEDPDKRLAAGAHFATMWEDNRVPVLAEQQYGYWTLMADHAESIRDARLFKRIVRAFDDGLPASEMKRATVKKLEARLKDFPKK